MVKIIGAGFGRTGTASMKAALEHLGFGPCYHMFDVIAGPARARDWNRALDGEVMDWNEVFAGFHSTVDWPGCAFWSELADTYPDAKVILTVRDPQRWYDSMYNTIYQFYRNDPDPDLPSEIVEIVRPTVGKMIWNGAFGGRFEDRDHAIEVFERHNAEVRRSVPAERLLVYEVGSGWESLCEFLGVEVPEVDFPHVNDAASMPELVEQVITEGKFRSPLESKA